MRHELLHRRRALQRPDLGLRAALHARTARAVLCPRGLRRGFLHLRACASRRRGRLRVPRQSRGRRSLRPDTLGRPLAALREHGDRGDVRPFARALQLRELRALRARHRRQVGRGPEVLPGSRGHPEYHGGRRAPNRGQPRERAARRGGHRRANPGDEPRRGRLRAGDPVPVLRVRRTRRAARPARRAVLPTGRASRPISSATSSTNTPPTTTATSTGRSSFRRRRPPRSSSCSSRSTTRGPAPSRWLGPRPTARAATTSSSSRRKRRRAR